LKVTVTNTNPSTPLISSGRLSRRGTQLAGNLPIRHNTRYGVQRPTYQPCPGRRSEVDLTRNIHGHHGSVKGVVRLRRYTWEWVSEEQQKKEARLRRRYEIRRQQIRFTEHSSGSHRYFRHPLCSTHRMDAWRETEKPANNTEERDADEFAQQHDFVAF
jgi:hypothetical protein